MFHLGAGFDWFGVHSSVLYVIIPLLNVCISTVKWEIVLSSYAGISPGIPFPTAS